MHGLPNHDPGRKIDWGRTSTDYATYRPGYPASFSYKLAALDIGLPGQRNLDLGTGPETRQSHAQCLDADKLVGPLSDVLVVTVREKHGGRAARPIANQPGRGIVPNRWPPPGVLMRIGLNAPAKLDQV